MFALKQSIKALLRLRMFAPLMAVVFWWRIQRLFGQGGHGSLRVLAFSSFRWRQDLKALADAGDVTIDGVDDNLLHWINAIFAPVGKTFHKNYFQESDAEVLALRRRLVDYLAVVGRVLKAIGRFDCAVTAAIHYDQEHAWAEALDRAGLPFVAIHKEFTIIDDRHLDERIKLATGRAQKFVGTAICVCSERAKRMFAAADLTDASRIHVTGLLRMDGLLKEKAKPTREELAARTEVTLFSFGHYSGGFGPSSVDKRRSHYFSHGQEGFVDLFRDVHVGFAEMALRHPELTFSYKTKPVSGWMEQIRGTVEQELGRPFDSIPNLKIADPWYPAPELMRRSRLVVGFNSTVLIEARLLGCPTVMPCFGEATEKYPFNVYFHGFHDLFAAPTSKQEYLNVLEAGIAGQPIHPEDTRRVSELTRSYVSYDDGRSGERVVHVLSALARREAPTPMLDADSLGQPFANR